ncbi:prephenate dehydrogenase [Lentisphaera araneosa HTCC2155]|uniref:Prephenate dehydrogenase n=1 Tax=Lentisphaera araneosa HTCC2155 TaxID=313628 RepID=A6DLL2_9BACT|nr:prephenate dehydrogenase/arogenate dehydrogenase family protein [Lentisphaera araneosa]EDM27467.1 prephenate dehydrogenase [Lentisphaera araneosa HTCC2155]
MRDHIKIPEVLAIAGLGQMGASFAMAVRKFLPEIRLSGWAPSQQEAEKAVELGIVDEASTNTKKVLSEADVVMLAMPISPLIDFVNDHVTEFKIGSIVTDLSSVKSDIVDGIRPGLCEQGVHFIGGHPMAGTEKTGMENGDADMYTDKVVFLTPFCTDDPAALSIVRELWRSIGGNTFEVDAVDHDVTLARSSHVLHINSNITTHVCLQAPNKDLAMLACGGAFRDTSRISSSNPDLWVNVTKHNKQAILKAMDETLDQVSHVRSWIEGEDWDSLYKFLAEGKALRDDWWDSFNKLDKK